MIFEIFVIIWFFMGMVNILYLCKNSIEGAVNESELIFSPGALYLFFYILAVIFSPYWFFTELRERFICWNAFRKVKRICRKNGIDINKYKTE